MLTSILSPPVNLCLATKLGLLEDISIDSFQPLIVICVDIAKINLYPYIALINSFDATDIEKIIR